MPDIFIISWAYQCISFTPRWVYESWLPIHWGSSVSFYRRTEEFLCNSEYRIYNGDGHISTPINSQIQWILKDWIWCAKSDRTGHTVGINPILSDLNSPWASNFKAGGTLKQIKLIGMNFRFAKIHKMAQEQRWLKN